MNNEAFFLLKRNPELYDTLIAIRAYSAISDKVKSEEPKGILEFL